VSLLSKRTFYINLRIRVKKVSTIDIIGPFHLILMTFMYKIPKEIRRYLIIVVKMENTLINRKRSLFEGRF
jgi:hypothetical protein